MLTPAVIDRVVRLALEEDAPWGDLTSEALIPADAVAHAELVAREAGVFSGGDVLRGAFTTADSRIRVEVLAEESERFDAGSRLARIDGPARSVLTAERVALNLVQRMCGVSTLTARFVDAVRDTPARIVDTRKTTPGLRALERHAVVAGGGRNHRRSLSDAVLAKDNHLAMLSGRPLADVLRDARKRLPHTTHIEVEVDRVDQIEPVMSAGVDTIMFDNFSLGDLRRGVELVGGRAVVEASGGVTLDSVGEIARTGVDVISAGALTHSAVAIDLGLDIAVAEGAVTPGAP